MIVWLTRELSMRGRIIVTSIVGAWMIMMMVLMVWYNVVIVHEMKREFMRLREDHTYMRTFMEQNIRKFATTIQKNTEAVKQIAEPDK